MILQEVIRQRKLELQRKEEKDKERKDLAELRRKNWAEEQKRYIWFRAYLGRDVHFSVKVHDSIYHMILTRFQLEIF